MRKNTFIIGDNFQDDLFFLLFFEALSLQKHLSVPSSPTLTRISSPSFSSVFYTLQFERDLTRHIYTLIYSQKYLDPFRKTR